MGDILVGDVREMLRTLPAESAHVCVTSPPYWSLRSYSTNPQLWGGDPACAHDFDPEPTAEGYTGKRWWQNTGALNRKDNPEAWAQITRGDTCRHCGCWRGELGGEPDPDSYVAHIVEVFREVRRVLRRDGTCWVNLGDSYNNASPTRNKASEAFEETFTGGLVSNGTRRGVLRTVGLKPKDLVGIPWRVAFALQADGWYLRSDIIWSKPNPMPESVTDRPTKSHEYLFLLAKSIRYYYDADAVREPHTEPWRGQGERESATPHNGRLDDPEKQQAAYTVGVRQYNPVGRNRRSVWEIPTQPTPEAHFATYPEKLVEPCILAGTSERGVCRQCGAPWRRVVEKIQRPRGDAFGVKDIGREHDHGQGGRPYMETVSTATTGWQPTCTCHGKIHKWIDKDDIERRRYVSDLALEDHPVVPATCLDPFLGSGTTARVAERLGRNWIGIELSEEYAAIARRRTAQMAWDTTVFNVAGTDAAG